MTGDAPLLAVAAFALTATACATGVIAWQLGRVQRALGAATAELTRIRGDAARRRALEEAAAGPIPSAIDTARRGSGAIRGAA